MTGTQGLQGNSVPPASATREKTSWSNTMQAPLRQGDRKSGDNARSSQKRVSYPSSSSENRKLSASVPSPTAIKTVPAWLMRLFPNIDPAPAVHPVDARSVCSAARAALSHIKRKS
jgi:hypothetical protein